MHQPPPCQAVTATPAPTSSFHSTLRVGLTGGPPRESRSSAITFSAALSPFPSVLRSGPRLAAHLELERAAGSRRRSSVRFARWGIGVGSRN